MADEWKCIRCETLNDATRRQCELCDTPRFYSQADVDALLQQEAERQQQRLAHEWERLRQEQASLHALQQQLAVERQRFEEDQKRPGVAESRAERIVPSAERTHTPPTAGRTAENTLANSLGMVFMLIPAREFLMGSDTGSSDEKPVHRVRISRQFYLSQHVVTQGQWQAVMGNNPSRFTGDSRLPVEHVSWDDVQDFIRRLKTREGLVAISGPSALGSLFGLQRAQEESVYYRLPTEAEWEYAARAGSTTAYSFGDDPRQLGAYAWYSENAGGKPHLVGQRQPNPWGLYDMHGNVWEWVQDWYGAYTAGAVTDPQGPSSGSTRVRRGGSWSHDASICRSAYRSYGAPGSGVDYLGFRLLRTAS